MDFTEPKTFRDLSRPMGAQSEKRREMFNSKYRDSVWEPTCKCMVGVCGRSVVGVCGVCVVGVWWECVVCVWWECGGSVWCVCGGSVVGV